MILFQKYSISTIFCLVALTEGANALLRPLTGHTPSYVHSALDLGAERPDKPLRLRFWLKMHQPGHLSQSAGEVRDPSSARYQQWVSKSELEKTYYPSTSEAMKVQKYLVDHGLKNVQMASNHRYITADATVNEAQNLLQVSMHRFLDKQEVKTANIVDPQVDETIADSVAYVGGLSGQIMRPMAKPQTDLDTGKPMQPVPFLVGASKASTHETVCFAATKTVQFTAAGGMPQATYLGNRFGGDITSPAPHSAPCGYGPSEVQSSYGIDKLVSRGLDGTGQTIVIVDAYGSPTIQDDAKTFSQNYGLPPPQLTVLQPEGVPVVGPWSADQQKWAGETTLDVEWAHVMAPGAKIVLIETVSNSDDNLDAALALAIDQNLGNQISNSWDGVEALEDSAHQALFDVLAQTAVLRGISLHFSSGDDGDSMNLLGFVDVGYPSSSPLVTSVGGTTLALNADHSIQFQAGWGNNGVRIADGVDTKAAGEAMQNPPLAPPTSLGFVGGAGGGASRIYPKPAFQNGIAGPGRMQPDIAFLADPYTGVEVVQSGFDANGNPQPGNLTVQVIGGTSLACPMFTGLWAIANQAHGSSLGQAAPLLYALPSSAVIDILPVSSSTNVTGSVTDASGTTALSAIVMARPGTETPFLSALYNSPNSPFRWNVITFGTDSSLPVQPGWDPVTGLGVPNGVNFIEALR